MIKDSMTLAGLGDVEEVNQPAVDHLKKFVIQPKEHIDMLPDVAERLKKRFELRKRTPTGPKPVVFKSLQRKHETRLHRELAKLDPLFEIAVEKNMKVLEHRLLRRAISLQERIEGNEALQKGMEGRSKRAAGRMKKTPLMPSYWVKRNKMKGEHNAKSN